ncbi:MAG: TIGR04190 family B12-binding domain/radical SAM domain protein [Candidatus Korarchaeum sp.]|nr:TIGR04190 family B12-binding domain/radical SAM domain protein [Candidatus Korarchaeum sp.]MDW8034826.1 TIGR04190 family B12-binding domain/radical SAM domain protein [Candidatus Korarchaeum sp.]
MKLDVALIHPPSVYDFRKIPSYAYMVSEVIPSRYVFDMIPYGFLTLATYLERHGFNVTIFNIAAKMLEDIDFDVESYLKGVEADTFGIDLHWMVHAQGAIEIARLIKRLHPDSKVILGGLSSTIFRHEIMSSYSFVDAVITGDSGELPLLKYLEEGPERAPNVIWREDGRIRENSISWVPESLDDFQIDHGFLLRNLRKTKDLMLSSPFASFQEAPIAGVITVKGCPFDCVTCGGSRYAYGSCFARSKLAKKSPEAIAEEVEGISNISKVPIFFVGDLRIGGISRLERVSKLLRDLDLENELIFEFFTPPPREVLGALRGASHNVYLQISPESPFENVRRAFGRPYANFSLEKMIRYSKELDFTRLDLYFMIGLPLQTRDQGTKVAEYFRKMREISKNLDSFISPLAPFIDPGSRAYSDPERYGYRLLFRGLEGHRKALLASHWIYSLNYETSWMSRREIAETTLDSYEALLTEKNIQGIVDDRAYELAIERVELDREVIKRIEGGYPIDDLWDRMRELASEYDVSVKKGLSLYPTEGLAERIRNPLARALLKALLIRK